MKADEIYESLRERFEQLEDMLKHSDIPASCESAVRRIAARAVETGIEYSEAHSQAVGSEPRIDADHGGMHTVPLVKRSYTMHQVREASKKFQEGRYR